MSAQKLDLAPEFTSNNSLNIDHGLVCTESLLTDDEIIDEFTMNDDGDNYGNCGSGNNEDDEVQVRCNDKPTKNISEWCKRCIYDTMTINTERGFAD